tara:strand:+ start:1112 stop:1666 length:555 start_codon:yes stop_codon:yes gene_type:complete
MAFATIDVTKGITGTIPVANGGTGLASGTADQFLKFTGTTTLASSTLGATGKVLQVVQVDNSTDLDLSSNTYTDFYSGAITPSATSSKVLVFWTVHSRSMTTISGFGSRLLRGTTNVWTTTRDYFIYSEDSSSDRHSTMFTYLDSPSTTSATTYKIQVACNSSNNIQFSGNSNQSLMTLMEIAG